MFWSSSSAAGLPKGAAAEVTRAGDHERLPDGTSICNWGMRAQPLWLHSCPPTTGNVNCWSSPSVIRYPSRADLRTNLGFKIAVAGK